MRQNLDRRVTATEGLAFNSLKSLIRWGDDFTVGQPDLDRQHQRIFELATDAVELARDPSAIERQRLRLQFDEFGRVLKEHFAFEEGELARVGYAKLDGHAAAHRAMLAELDFIDRRLTANGEGWAFQEEALVIVNFMLGVTVGHILHSDVDYARALPDQGIAAD